MFTLLALGAAFAAAPTPAPTPALGDAVLVYTYQAGYSVGINNFSATLTAYGATAVETSERWPEVMEDYRLILLWMSTGTFSADQVSDLLEWTALGGTLVMITDHDGFATSTNALNILAEDLGLETRLELSGYDTGCGHAASTVEPHPLAEGVKALEYALPGHLSVAGEGVEIFRAGSGYPLIAAEGNVVFVADLNVIDDSCVLPDDNRRFWENLFDGVCYDSDGDGHESPECGGTDCDNSDATVYEGAAENPDDGIDQDCDGYDTVTCYEDLDGDGYGSDVITYQVEDCVEAGVSDIDGDCDDGDPGSWPGGAEIADDGVDQDCNGYDAITCYIDNDGDGYGDDVPVILEEVLDCEDYFMTSEGGDCGTEDATIYPGAEEIPGDGVDQDCDGADAELVVDSADPGDTGATSGNGDGGGEDKGGCACSSASPAGVGLVLALFSGLIAARRREEGPSA
jgi:hypothetical protein